MTTTQYDWCETCQDKVELVPVYVDEHIGNLLVCYRCGQ